MSAASEAFLGKVAPALDDAIRCSQGLDEDPSWLVSCSGQVCRITLFRRRPNGSIWFEGDPVDVPGFNNIPRRPPGAVELRRRCATAIARAEGLKDELLKSEAAAAVPANLSAAQLDGQACAYCHRPMSDGGAMVPLKLIAGIEFTGAHSTLFVCDPPCEGQEAGEV